MLFYPLLCFTSLVAASPSFGSWGRLFTSASNQLPLRTLPELLADGISKDSFFEDKKHADEGTIWEIISNNPRFTKLTSAIKFADAVKYFDDKDADFTFFATPDWALSREKGNCDDADLSEGDHMSEDDATSFALVQGCHWSDVLTMSERLDTAYLRDDDKRERRKKFLKRLIQASLAYEALPDAVDSFSLGDNTTYASKLAIPGVLDGQPLRVRVEQRLLPPSTTINFYSKVVYSDVKATNGIIHVVNRPILPSLSGFQTLFLLPSQFSILTSAIQRSGLTDNVDLRYVKSDDGDGYELQGASALTLFAPTNLAFERLPLKLRLFLFSPLGYRALRKVLEYHVVPGVVVHADYRYNQSADTSPDAGKAYRAGYGKVISDVHLDLSTALKDHFVHAHIKKLEYTLPVPGPNKPSAIKTEISTNHRVVLVSDVVTSNAAVHILDRLLDPRDSRHHDDCEGFFCHKTQESTWDDWEDWLIQWAESD
ncbi:Stabilin-2 [Leucoagaricus sp. SymC.cos]|nr:Stabilin-2 [Leucoagaricus sp. SymC.cos]